MWQAEHVRAQLSLLYPQCSIEILGMTTRGDQILDRALSKVGGKGLFVKELEVAMAEGRADLAVHSLKDVPMDLPEGFELAAVLEREDPRDAFVSNDYASLDELPAGAVVGTSSLRRQSLIAARYPHLVIKPLRGNLDTRLGKLDRGDYAAIILAAAGLKRLGLPQRIRALLEPERQPAGRRAGRDGDRNRLGPHRHRPARGAGAAEPHAPPRRPCAPSARCRRYSAAAARFRWPRSPPSTAAACTCARWSPRRTARAPRAPKLSGPADAPGSAGPAGLRPARSSRTRTRSWPQCKAQADAAPDV